MTLDEAIKYAEDMAFLSHKGSGNTECEQNHRQLAEWLRDYKRLKEREPCEEAELVSVRQELLDRGNEVVSFRQLVERFEEVEEEYKGVPWNLRQIYNNFNILIGEKPCEDAVSRQAAIDAFERFIHELGIEDEPYNYGEMALSAKNVPSVIPQPKTGHWIYKQYDGYPECGDYHCSECDKIDNHIPAYCPHCGRRMVVPQESEDKVPHSLRAKLSGLRYKGILEDKDYKRLCHALDLEKAEQESCEDAISRQAVLDLIEHYNSDGLGSVFYGYEEGVKFANAVNKLPPVKPQEPRWIPVSKRLPESCGMYIVTRKIYDCPDTAPIIMSDESWFDGQNTWHNDNRINHERGYLSDVIAWMPLPTPYESQERSE